jgi:hypothetical protein
MPRILSWLVTDGGPYEAKPGGGFQINPAFKVERKNRKPSGKTLCFGYPGKNSKDFIWTSLQFKLSNYYGLVVDKTGKNWTQEQLWEYYDFGQFVGMPQVAPNAEWNGLSTFAGYFTGQYADAQITKNQSIPQLPIFRQYGLRSSGAYFYILPASEANKFPLTPTGTRPERDANPRVPPPVKTPPATTPSRPSGSADSMERQIGAGTGTSVAIGTNPDIFVLPGEVFDDNAFSPRPPRNPPSGGGGGKWVTGADGKQYYLPPGIDFEGLKREYERLHPKPETKIVVRMPKGYASPKTTIGDKPRMTQIQLDLTESGRAIGEITRRFVFPYIPQNIRYADIGSEWQEIPRALNVPFVDWNRYKLMKVSMDFLVAAQFKPGGPSSSGEVSDGLMNSVIPELNILRQMATNKFPVYLEGFDDILQVQMARSRYEKPRGMQFVINDLSITAARRTIDEQTGLATNPSQISAAQVSLTLQEIPIETVTIVKLPPLDLGTPLVNKPGGGSGGGIPSLGLQSNALTGLNWQIP